MQMQLHHSQLRAVVDTKGGELISLKDAAGTEYIWSGDPAYWSGRNPILFPIVGKLPGGTARAKGGVCTMPQHGFGRRSTFSVAESGEDFVVFSLQENEETLAQYPYPFHLLVRHQLSEQGFFTEFEVQNTGTEPLPFCIGAHTAFRCPLHDGEAFEDYRLVFDQPETASSLLLTPEGAFDHAHTLPILSESDTIPLDHGIFDRRDTLAFDGLRSKGVRLIHKTGGHGVRMEFTDFPMIAFWTMPNVSAPYICLEPWHGCAAYDNDSGIFEDKPHCIILRSGESKTLRYTVTLINAK